MLGIVGTRESPEAARSAQLQPVVVAKVVRLRRVQNSLPRPTVDNEDRLDRRHNVRSRWVRRSTVGARARLVVVPEDGCAVPEAHGQQRLQPIRVNRLRFSGVLSLCIAVPSSRNIDRHVDAPPTAIRARHSVELATPRRHELVAVHGIVVVVASFRVGDLRSQAIGWAGDAQIDFAVGPGQMFRKALLCAIVGVQSARDRRQRRRVTPEHRSGSDACFDSPYGLVQFAGAVLAEVA